jgi:hypothetical protein
MSKRKVRKNGIGRIALGVIRKFVPGVTSVRDADDDLIVTVTDRDEKVSKKKDHNECAMATAVKRQEHATSVIISASTAYVIKGAEAVRYKVPEAVSREVVSFDRGSMFEPGEYKLKAQPKCSRLGTWRGKATKPDNSHSGGMVKRFVHQTANIRTGLHRRDA